MREERRVGAGESNTSRVVASTPLGTALSGLMAHHPHVSGSHSQRKEGGLDEGKHRCCKQPHLQQLHRDRHLGLCTVVPVHTGWGLQTG
jgi:hypothetical protein